MSKDSTFCQKCGTKITAIRSTKRFCSERCKKAHQRGMKTVPLTIPRTKVPKPTYVHWTPPNKGRGTVDMGDFKPCQHVPIKIPRKCPVKKPVSDLLEGL